MSVGEAARKAAYRRRHAALATAGRPTIAALPLLLAASAAAIPSGPADTQAARAAITAYIRGCEAIWAQANVAAQPALAPCLAEDYRGVSSHGAIAHKSDMATGGGAKAATFDYANVRFPAPTVAISQGEERIDTGAAEPRHLIWTDIWLLRDGGWQVVASQDTAVPADKPSQEKTP